MSSLAKARASAVSHTMMEVSKKVRRMFGLSLTSWENLMVGSLWVAALVAGVGALVAGAVGVSTWAVVWLQRQELAASKIEFDAYKLETAKQIADANAAGETAKAEAAEANKKAETERLERLKLEAQFAWRRIDDAHQAEMVSELSKNPQSVFVIWITGDPEAMLLAWQLIAIFQKSHWHAGGEGRQYPNSIITNVVVTGPGASSVSALLASAGLAPEAGPLPPFTGMIVPHETGVTEANANVVILVGSRLRPTDAAVMEAVKGQLHAK